MSSVSPPPLSQHDTNAQRDKCEVDLFLEHCSSLYNLILDLQHDNHNNSLPLCSQIEEMAAELEIDAMRLCARRPDMEGTIRLRVGTIDFALEQLRLIDREEARGCRVHPPSEVRSWLQSAEQRLSTLTQQFENMGGRGDSGWTKLASDQQVLQIEIQTEGQTLINKLEQYFKKRVESNDGKGKLLSADPVRKRYYKLLLDCRELQIRIELESGGGYASDSCESDPELSGPPTKRRRRFEGDLHPSDTESEEEDDEADTLPFAASEYESIMDDGRTTASSSVSLPSPSLPSNAPPSKWDSCQQDIGYSSGENSIHEALHTIGEEENSEEERARRKRIDDSPVKSFYRTVKVDEMSDSEFVKGSGSQMMALPKTDLSESMIVNYCDLNTTVNSPEYDEVLALLDDSAVEERLPTDMNASFHEGTRWREIKSDGQTRRRSSREAQEDIAKNSCDASSEDSSDWDPCPNESFLDGDLMSRSFNSTATDMPQSLKRDRKGGLMNSSLLLDCSSMEASFCSTRSELPPCKSRSVQRKKLRVRRFPRSMSDGEQLGVGNKTGVDTPVIRVSPPRTPLARSTRLLQQLEAELVDCCDSDTAPDTDRGEAHYEWDDYNPPAKDESSDMVADTAVGSDMLNMDDDFHSQLPHPSVSDLVEQSMAQLRMLQSVKLTEETMKAIAVQSVTSIRQINLAIKMQQAGHPDADLSPLLALRAGWQQLQARCESPVPRVLEKVQECAVLLQSLSADSRSSPLLHLTSREEVGKARDAMLKLHKRLSTQRDELSRLISSRSVCEQLDGISGELSEINRDFDKGIEKIGKMVESLSHVQSEWSSMVGAQKEMRNVMMGVESRLASGAFEPAHLAQQLKDCGDRMAGLETMCNGLSESIGRLREKGEKGEKACDDDGRPDFAAELAIYAHALNNLRIKLAESSRVPTPPCVEPLGVCRTSTQTDCDLEMDDMDEVELVEDVSGERARSLPSTVYQVVGGSRSVRLILLSSLLCALLALLLAAVHGSSFGPHLSYVRGPPPI